MGIGVAAPGLVDSDRGVVLSAPTLGWKEISLRARWESRFRLPVIMENKARGDGGGFSRAARGVKDFVYVSIGTDIGSTVDAAAVIDGIPFRRTARTGGGCRAHDPRTPWRDVYLRPAGCWRAQADVGREVAMVEARLARGESSVLQGRAAEHTLEHRAVHQAALEGDPLAMEVFRSVRHKATRRGS